ncbi:MAG: helical backbone metal receptor [Pseudomonadota bacterium]
MKVPRFFVQLCLSLVGLAFSVMGFSAFPQASGTDRWVSTSPQLTELLFQLDLGKKIVGTTEQSLYPSDAKPIRRVGQLFNPNIESILACEPTLVLWDDSSFNQALDLRLQALGISSLKLSLNSVENVFRDAQLLIDRYRSGKKSSDFIRAEIDWEIAQKKRTNISFIALAWGDPPILFGRNTFLYSLIEGLGGIGTLPRVWSRNFLKVSDEWIMAQNPSHVFYLEHDEATSFFMNKQCQKWWPQGHVQCVGVPAEKFARASFTPFLSLADLQILQELKK